MYFPFLNQLIISIQSFILIYLNKMSSDSENAPKKKKASKLCLDTQNQEQQQQERQRLRQEKQRRKRQRRERQERQRLQREKQEESEQSEEQNYNVLLAQDSNSHITFSQIRANIKHKFPHIKDHYYQQHKSVEKKVKRQKVEKRQRSPKREQSKIPKNSHPKMEQKDELVYQLAKRWWYALPEWPPKHYDYAQALTRQGYRLVSLQSFKKEQEVVNGMIKVHELQGYRGIYKSTNKLIDVRPKESCPSCQNFKKKDISQLIKLIKIAIQNQIQALTQVEFKQNGDIQLLVDLRRELQKYKN